MLMSLIFGSICHYEQLQLDEGYCIMNWDVSDQLLKDCMLIATCNLSMILKLTQVEYYQESQ
jgi:hypothetical protein